MNLVLKHIVYIVSESQCKTVRCGTTFQEQSPGRKSRRTSKSQKMFRTQTTVLTLLTSTAASTFETKHFLSFSHVFPSIFHLISMKSASNVWYDRSKRSQLMTWMRFWQLQKLRAPQPWQRWQLFFFRFFFLIWGC